MQAEYDDASLNPELDSEDIQLAGFVAPLTFDGDDITEFLLVPYFGACIHVPPPPANQTVMVTLADGESLSLEESWGAVWVAGKMMATTTRYRPGDRWLLHLGRPGRGVPNPVGGACLSSTSAALARG